MRVAACEENDRVDAPLTGTTVVELPAIGPVPFCGMLLAGLGADVIQIQRPGGRPPLEREAHRILDRDRRRVELDLKTPEGTRELLRLVEGADILLEGWRPGIAERLGVGPQVCLERNPRLVYGRMSGYGQDGPLSTVAGHDINFLAITGALHLIGRFGAPPTIPLNLVADFGGGGMLLAAGVLSALIRTFRTGRGTVVDAAMIDGVALLLAMPLALRGAGIWRGDRGENLLDGGAPWYDVYRCADGRYVAVGAIEERFYHELLKGLGLDRDEELPNRDDPANWPVLRGRFAACFGTRTRDEWAERFAGSDACVTPVLTPEEAAANPHLVHRGVYREQSGTLAPAPAPRLDGDTSLG